MEKIDNLDKKILSILSMNARIPFKDVAAECGVSRAAIHQRVQHLIEGNVIMGSGFDVNPKSLGYSTCTYVGITLETLAAFGVRVLETPRGWHVPGGQRYRSSGRVRVEGDWSAAAFWLTANALGGRVECEGLSAGSAQGDRAIARMLNGLGGEIDVPTLNGTVKYTVPEGTQNGTEFRLRGKGIPQVRSSYVGDLIIRVRVEVPTKLTEKQKELLRQFDEATTGREYGERKSFLEKMKSLFDK